MNRGSNDYANTSYTDSRNMRTFIASGFFGSAVTEDGEFLKILEEFDYSGEEAAKALQFAAACMNYLGRGLL